MSFLKLSHRIGFVLIAGAAALVGPGHASGDQNPNEAGTLLRQCEAMLSGVAEITARMSCENTIWSTMRAIEQIKLENPGMKIAYCAPGEISVTRGATLYVEYVNAHPETVHGSAEHALILALEAAYPCQADLPVRIRPWSILQSEYSDEGLMKKRCLSPEGQRDFPAHRRHASVAGNGCPDS